MKLSFFWKAILVAIAVGCMTGILTYLAVPFIVRTVAVMVVAFVLGIWVAKSENNE